MKKSYPKTYKKNYQKPVMYKTPKPKVDMKYTDNAVQNQSVTSSGTFTSLFANLVRGDNGLNNFNGNNIYPKYIQFDYHVNTNQNYNSCRVMIFQWEDGTPPNLATILANTAAGIATICPPNVSAKHQLKVLWDDKVLFAPTAGGDSTVIGQGICKGSCFIPERKLKTVRFASSSNNVQDQNIFVLTISDDSVPTYPAIYWHSRVAFTD